MPNLLLWSVYTYLQFVIFHSLTVKTMLFVMQYTVTRTVFVLPYYVHVLPYYIIYMIMVIISLAQYFSDTTSEIVAMKF